MRLLPRRRSRVDPLVSVVVPVYDVAAFLPECLDSVLGQTGCRLEVVVVDDGSTDTSGKIADEYAARDDRLRVVHTDNHGLGAARNVGIRHATGDYLGFLDSDDVLPPDALATLAGALDRAPGSDLVTGSIVRWEADGLHEPPWMHRLHAGQGAGRVVRDEPEILGDVFAWNKLFRRSFWDAEGLAWPEGVRYEDQPTTTRAFLRARAFEVVPDIVYHWRIRGDGSSITQQRASVPDLTDRILTKRMSLASVREYGEPAVTGIFVDRVLAGDMWRYFLEIPGCPDEWWRLLRDCVVEFWGDHSLMYSGLPPVHRLVGWLVEQDRRCDATAVIEYAASHEVARVTDPSGHRRIDVPGLLPATVDPVALALRDYEV